MLQETTNLELTVDDCRTALFASRLGAPERKRSEGVNVVAQLVPVVMDRLFFVTPGLIAHQRLAFLPRKKVKINLLYDGNNAARLNLAN